MIQINHLNYKRVKIFCGDNSTLYNNNLAKLNHGKHKDKDISIGDIQTHLDDLMRLIEEKDYKFKHIARSNNHQANDLANRARIQNAPCVVRWLL